MWQYQNTDELYHYGRLRYEMAENIYSVKKDFLLFLIKEKNGPKKKSKHRLKIEQQYRKLGYSKEEAEKKANNKIKTEKILLGIAGASIAIGAAYAARKLYRDKVDRVIKAGHKFQRIEATNTDKSLYDVFYASNNKHDNKRYYALLGNQRIKQTGEAYIMKMKSTSDIKVASKDKALNAFKKLCQDDKNFKSNFNSVISIYDENLNNRFQNNSMRKKDWNTLYDTFNRLIPDLRANDDTKKVRDTFLNELKKSGYSAIQDINDMKYSGYSTKNPLIIFDNSKISVSSMDEIKDKNLWLKNVAETAKGVSTYKVEQFISKYGGLTIGTSGTAAIVARTSNAKNYEKLKKNVNKLL